MTARFMSILRSWKPIFIIIVTLHLLGACSSNDSSDTSGVADMFGWAIDIFGDTAMVGSPGAGMSLSNQDPGKVRIYRLDDGYWRQTQTLTASDEVLRFGYSVRISGNTAIVGAPDAPSGGLDRGQAFIFEYINGTWMETQSFSASDKEDSARFGEAVSISESTAIVGSPFASSGGSKRGQAYVFERQDDTWVQTQILTPSLPANMGWFGFYLAISGDTTIVGQPGGYAEDFTYEMPGRVYIFQRVNSQWTETQVLTASDQSPSDGFGLAVALQDDIMIVGAPGSPAGGERRGKAYVFERTGQDWAETQILFAPDAINGDAFGASAAFSGDSAIIGAPLVDLGGTDRGQAYLFDRATTTWSLTQVLAVSDPTDNAWFGQAVAVSKDIAIGGSPGKIWVSNGNVYQTSIVGRAYSFVRLDNIWTQRQLLE